MNLCVVYLANRVKFEKRVPCMTGHYRGLSFNLSHLYYFSNRKERLIDRFVSSI